MASATGDAECRRRAGAIVDELAACQKAAGTGILCAFPESKQIFAELAAGQIKSDRLFNLNGGYVPLYVTHKVMAGLRDAWPRGTERRHYRAAAAFASLASLERAGPPEKVWALMVPSKGATFKDVFRRVQKFDGFGPWIAFKIADMADRSGWAPVDFTDCPLDLYRDPRKGAALVKWGDVTRWREANRSVIGEVAAAILAGLGGRLAPPMYDRPLNIQEAETIMCKFKGHVAGRYPVGKDVREIMHALDGWGTLASRMRNCSLLPKLKEDNHV
jgi:hypothetical protein